MGRSQTAKGMRLLRKLTAELRMLIAGDIGGTKTDLAIYSSQSGPHSPLAQTERHSADYPSLQAMVVEFLGQVKLSVDVASRSEEHTSELQSPCNLVCRLLLEKKKKKNKRTYTPR